MEANDKSPIEAFREGLSARVRGCDLESNPYRDSTAERFLWQSGWLEPDHPPGTRSSVEDRVDAGRCRPQDA
jgi:hypothetical protein